MWEKEKQLQQDRIARYRERPWEFKGESINLRELVLTLSVCASALFGLLFLLSFVAALL
jgi:hypothetical protein